MKCDKCGAYLPAGTNVCPRCSERPGAGKQIGNRTNAEQKPWTGGQFILLCILALGIPVVGVLIGGMNLKNPVRGPQAKKILIVGCIPLCLGLLAMFGQM